MDREIVARSPVMRRALGLARAAARSDVPLLLSGEPGSGKELIARLVHAESPRAKGPFLAVRCDALPAKLVGSELFGDRPAGARDERPGALEDARGGTLYLDEVCALPLGEQRRLVAAIYERELRAVGEAPRPLDVRVVMTSERELDAEVDGGRLHPDLRAALGGIELLLPPLRDRREDVLPLARVALSKVAARLGRRAPGLTPRAASRLLRHRWPGNVRELMNVMERAVLLCEGARIDQADLPVELGGIGELAAPASERLADVEREHILRVVARSRSKAEAAERLGIGTATLFRKLRQYGEPGD
jgi:DNA-binding NtrC family response regulator